MIPLVFFVYNIYVPWHWKNTRIANTFNKWKLFFVDSIHLSRKIMLAFLLSGNIHKSIWTDMDTITNIGSYLIMTSSQVFFLPKNIFTPISCFTPINCSESRCVSMIFSFRGGAGDKGSIMKKLFTQVEWSQECSLLHVFKIHLCVEWRGERHKRAVKHTSCTGLLVRRIVNL